MEYKDLDDDTRAIIETMCYHTGKTKEQAILALVEFGMLSMVAAVCPEKQFKIMEVVFGAVEKDAELKETAEVYSACWELDVASGHRRANEPI
jgi:hypothetical protein